jgi:hypothetical protein
MERTSLPKGLDHPGPDIRAMAGGRPGPWPGKGINAGGLNVRCRARSVAEAAVTVRDPCWPCPALVKGHQGPRGPDTPEGKRRTASSAGDRVARVPGPAGSVLLWPAFAPG